MDLYVVDEESRHVSNYKLVWEEGERTGPKFGGT